MEQFVNLVEVFGLVALILLFPAAVHDIVELLALAHSRWWRMERRKRAVILAASIGLLILIDILS